MKAIVLAAGRGSRMRALTEDRPKGLVELAGRPLFDWQLRALRGGGAEEIGVVRGYRGGAFDRYGLQAFENPQWESTNMVASLRCADDWLRQAPCLVSYSDIFYGAASVARLAAAPGDRLAIAYDPNWRTLWARRFEDPLSDAETFRLDGAGKVVEIGKKPRGYDEVEGQYMGLLRFTPRAWQQTAQLLDSLEPEVARRLDMTGLLGRLIAAGAEIGAVAIEEAWGEVDSETDLAVYEAALRAAEPGITAILG